MRRLILLFLVFIMGCSKDKTGIDPVSFVTAHIWKSTGYVINGTQYDYYNQVLGFNQSTKNGSLQLNPGDSLKYIISYELVFTNGDILKETRNYDSYYKCSQCDSYVYLKSEIFESQNVYLIDDKYLYATSHDSAVMDSTSSDSHKYSFIDDKTMKLFDWHMIQNDITSLYEVVADGNELQPNQELPVDVIFEAKL